MTKIVGSVMAMALVAFGAMAKGPDKDLEAPGAETALRMNQMQVVGTHNSYHVKPPEPLFSQIKVVYPDAVTWDYTHAPLDVQLERGVRSFELDVYHDPAGTKVLHVPQYDKGTTCETLVDGLTTIREWSKAHPRHVPVIVLVELKDEPISQVATPILPFDKAAIDQVDREIRQVLNEKRLLTPDDVRGDAATLSDAIHTDGWPLLEEVRGTVMLVLHARGAHARHYTAGSPSLEGRAMFIESRVGTPYASVFIRNDPRDPGIPELVKQGYIVRTRADSDLRQAAANNTARRDAAFPSGAHIVSTDFPPGEAHADTGYVVALPGGACARPNPVNGGS
ncbi:MAG: hypothetical protein GY851_26630 [bacterium]|nr:hypothetical protein [bacterium]